MDPEFKGKLEEQRVMIEAIYKSVEKTRKYFLWMIWITVIFVVLPIVALAFVLPSFISSYTNYLNSLGI